MKTLSLKPVVITLVMAIIITILLMLNGCATSQKVSDKSGALLWGENCQRCHNTPSASTFSKEKWETIGMHMQSRALITDKERDKIVAFLKQ